MRIDKAERRWVGGFAIILMVITTIPYLIGFSMQTEDWVYTGFLFGVEDGNSYIAKMYLGEAGYWLFHTPYTAYEQNGFLAFLPYILLGKLASPPDVHIQLVVLFHIFRWLGGIICCIATYDFISLFIKSISLRRLGLAIAIFGGGLGWLSLLGLSSLWKDGLPLEFYSPETFGFLSILGLPHLAIARAVLLWGLASYLKPLEIKNKVGNIFINSGWWLILGFFQPLTALVGGVVILVHLAFQLAQPLFERDVSLVKEKKSRFSIYFQRAIWTGIFALPLTLYNFLSFQFDPFLSVWQKQNLILSPPVLDYFLGYAVLLAFAIIGIVWIIRKKAVEEYSLVILWVVIFPLLAYVPYNLQRRLPEGMWVAWVVLGLVGLDNIPAKWRVTSRILLSLAFLSTMILYTGSLFVFSNPGNPLYRSADEVKMFEYLVDNAPGDSVVLALHSTSNALPAWAPMRTLVGLGPESMGLAELLPRIQSFYSQNVSVEQKMQLLDEFNIRYVICGPEEAAYGSCTFDKNLHLKLRFSQGDYWLYEYLEQSAWIGKMAV